ncbi:unnamed protein product [Effrenium voratum]|uniref:PH domain-containing protein n=1 Tax=Effrenium voratum TaxID=2562239 RepID=A0AA36NMG2_9DINO|nr:unnamed protein product [Effrenium voratum]
MASKAGPGAGVPGKALSRLQHWQKGASDKWQILQLAREVVAALWMPTVLWGNTRRSPWLPAMAVSHITLVLALAHAAYKRLKRLQQPGARAVALVDQMDVLHRAPPHAWLRLLWASFLAANVTLTHLGALVYHFDRRVTPPSLRCFRGWLLTVGFCVGSWSLALQYVYSEWVYLRSGVQISNFLYTERLAANRQATVAVRPGKGGLERCGRARFALSGLMLIDLPKALSPEEAAEELGLTKGHQHFTSIPSGEEVFRRFRRLNLRETFSACVVEKLLESFPPNHRRRKYMDGPTFRERLDYHQYIVFPAGLNAHITANKNNEATKLQKAPLRDADVIVYSLDVAIDSEQLRSVNSLLSYLKNFTIKDTMTLSRPSQAIRDCRTGRRSLVKAWWQHAVKAVQIICKIPKRELCAEDLQLRATTKERYISAVNDAREVEQQVRAVGAPEGQQLDAKSAAILEHVRDMQMKLKLKDILDWRVQARERADLPEVGKAKEEEEEDVSQGKSPKSKALVKEQIRPMPGTLQVKVNFQGFQVFFLVAQGGFWYTKCKPGNLVDEERPEEHELVPRRTKMQSRQPVVSAAINNIVLEVVQKGHKNYRIARWIELTVGSLDVENLNANKTQPSRTIVSLKSVQKHKGLPMCIFLGLNTFELLDTSFTTGDTPLSAVLEPWEGLLGHTKDQATPTTPAMLQNLGFLKDQVRDVGKSMTFAFARIGEVHALDWAPFRRRMLFFSKRGLSDMDMATDLVRRPSPEALMKELLVRLQRKVEMAVGKSNMLGSLEVELDGVNARSVDNYNRGMMLCKQANLSPLLLKVHCSGQPQAFQVQVHHLRHEASAAPSLSMLTGDGGVNMLPWKSTMLLLPQDDFHCTAGADRKLKTKETRSSSAKRSTNWDSQSQSPARKSRSPGKKQSPADTQQTLQVTLQGVASIATSEESPDGRMASESLEPLQPAYFVKWCRNGRGKLRYVEWKEDLKAIVWKDHEESAKPAGVFPVWKIQDICVGKHTPVLQEAEKPKTSCCLRSRGAHKLKLHLVVSVIAEDRTLDLQAETAEQHKRWAEGLVARFRAHVRSEHSSEAFATDEKVNYRTYPAKLRSDRCELRLACEKLQAMTSFSNTVQVMQGMESKDLEEPKPRRPSLIEQAMSEAKACRFCGQPLPLLDNTCASCLQPQDAKPPRPSLRDEVVRISSQQ